MRKKHLELIQKDESFFIQINTLTGRTSLLFDHPVFNWVLAKDFKNSHFQTRGRIELVPLRQKDLFIMEDIDAKGFRAQNFVYISNDVSDQFTKLEKWNWVGRHLFEFVTKSIAIIYLVVFYFAHMYVEGHYGTKGMIQLGFLFGPPIMIALPTLYYFLWSSKTQSSFLKFYFRFELMMMLVLAVTYMLFFFFVKYDPPPIQGF